MKLLGLGARAVWPLKRYLPMRVQSVLQYYRHEGHDLVGDPYALRQVPPGDIELMISRSTYGTDRPGYGAVSGDWDRQAYPFESNNIYGMFTAHFERGVPWEDTEQFQALARQLEAGDAPGGLDAKEKTVERYREYLSYWDQVYADMQRSGYKTQRELTAEDDFIDRTPTVTAEINVFIGRSGEFICWLGKHRLTVAKLLDLDAVPVLVRVRHTEWEAVRAEIAAAETVDELSPRAASNVDHPDVVDVVPGPLAASVSGETSDATPVLEGRAGPSE